MNWILIGMPGTGKSTVGVLLAKHLGYQFIDTDLLLSVKAGRTLPVIIQEEGYEGFLAMESAVGAGIYCDQAVIATGGSMVLSEEAMLHLQSLGKIIWLDTDLRILEKRLQSTMQGRGVATPKSMTVREIARMRKPYYRKWMDLHICSKGNPAAVVAQIVEAIEEI